MNRIQSDRKVPVNPAHLMVFVYLGLAAAAVMFLTPPLTELPGQLVTFSARYVSVLFSALPFVVAASVWTALTALVPHHPQPNRSIVVAAVRGGLRPLPMDSRLVPYRKRDPIAVAASGAFHPITTASAALTFGINSGLFLFYLVFAAATVVVAGVVSTRLVPASPKETAPAPPLPRTNAADRLSETASSELYHRLRFTVVGLLVAVAAHVLIPDSMVQLFRATPVISVTVMVFMALVLPVPAEVAPIVAMLFIGRVSHGAALAFVLVSAISNGRGILTAVSSVGVRSAVAFTATAIVLIVLLTFPLGSLATGALW